MWCAEMQMRNASEILAGRALRKKTANIDISAKPKYQLSIVLDPHSRSRTNFAPKIEKF